MKGRWEDWDRVFRGLPPVGYILRMEATTHHWLRFHSLPDGERYPTAPGEMVEVLKRHNAVASAVLGDGAEVIAWIAHYGKAAPQVDMALWHWAQPHARWHCDEAELETLDQARFLERVLLWHPGMLNDEFQLQALDKLGSTTLLAPGSGRAFCPYDGGMDLFLPSENDVDVLRSSFPDWVSKHPKGL